MDVAPDPQAPPATNDTDGAPKRGTAPGHRHLGKLQVNGHGSACSCPGSARTTRSSPLYRGSGRTQSMPLRLLNRLIEQGTMQVLTQQKVVDKRPRRGGGASRHAQQPGQHAVSARAANSYFHSSQRLVDKRWRHVKR